MKVEWKDGEIVVDVEIGSDSYISLAYFSEVRSKYATKLKEVSLNNGHWKGKQKWFTPEKWLQKDLELYFIVGYIHTDIYIYIITY